MKTSAPLPPAVRRLGWISLLTDVASEMAYPVVPLFLASVLGAPASVLGLIEGLAEALVSVMKGLSGWHSDRLGRRVPYIRLGYGLGALSKPLLAAAFAWPAVLAARLADRLGKGLRTTARDALIADSIQPAQAGRAFGFHRAMDTAGAVLGVAAALVLLWIFPGRYRLIFLLTALPGAAAVWLTMTLRETRTPEASPAAGPRPSWRDLPAPFWRALVPLGLFALANSTDTLLLLRARDLGLGDPAVIGAYILYNLVYAATAYPLGALSDRVGRWRLLLLGYGLYALVYLGFAETPAWGLWLLFPLYGLYMGLAEGAARAVAVQQSPAHMLGTALGVFYAATGLLGLAGSLAAGLLWDALGPAWAFRLGAGAALAAVLAALILGLPGRAATHRR